MMILLLCSFKGIGIIRRKKKQKKMFASLKVYWGISRKGWNRVLMRRCRERNRVDEDGPWTYISQLSRSVDDETYRYYYYYVPAGSDGDLSQICLRTGIAYSALSGVCPRCDRQLGRGLRGPRGERPTGPINTGWIPYCKAKGEGLLNTR